MVKLDTPNKLHKISCMRFIHSTKIVVIGSGRDNQDYLVILETNMEDDEIKVAFTEKVLS